MGGYVHSGVVSLLLIAVITLALVVTPPSPPGIAEFAPRATETIDEALKQQASQFGTGEGGDCAGGQDCADGGAGVPPTTTTTVPGTPPRRVIEQARVKHCVGDPPRQVEDPQSPPCANYWEGDNGGATSKGVTANEIKVAYPADGGSGNFERFLPFFNKRFQFYGRQIVGVPVPGNESEYALGAAERGVFAALDFQSFIHRRAIAETYLRELASREVVAIAARTRRFTDSEIRRLSPYYWQYEPSLEFLQRHVAALACRLTDRAARYGGPEAQLKARKFGVLFDRHTDGSKVPLDALNAALAQCGITPVMYEVVNDNTDQGALRAQNMRDTGVTTLIMMANIATVTDEMQRYSGANFEPELLMSGYGLPQHELQWDRFGDPARRSHMFGIAQFNKSNPTADEPAFWAATEAHPDDPGARQAVNGYVGHAWYHSLLLLASGIQQAGPVLTPETFAAGLEKTRFPNPGAGQAPYWQARVGFGPSDHTMVDDVAAVWWSDAAPAYRNPANARGGWCYVGRGTRRSALSWPTDIDRAFFDPDPTRCR